MDHVKIFTPIVVFLHEVIFVFIILHEALLVLIILHEAFLVLIFLHVEILVEIGLMTKKDMLNIIFKIKLIKVIIKINKMN